MAESQPADPVPAMASLSVALRASTTAEDDITIKCGDRTWLVHKSRLSEHSDFFESAFKGHWKETADGVIHLEDDHPAAIDVMIAHIYNNGKYVIAVQDPPVLVSEIYLHTYNIADKYNISPLAKDAAAAFKKLARDDVLHVRFPEVIRELYEYSPDDAVTLTMKAVVARLCAENENALTTRPEHKAFRELVADVTLFALAFKKAAIAIEMKKLDEHLASPRRPDVRIVCENRACRHSFVMKWTGGWSGKVYRCPYCAHTFTRNSYSGWKSHLDDLDGYD